ncbi:hypothetical protein ACE41R_05865 [Alteromonas macleodii]|uniref:hypothetical protein n=1 Tax=Alteromonas macleodii TaxID=28108 RepID=UPI0031409A1C
MKTYDDYLKEVTVMLKAGHNRPDILKVLKTTYLFNQDDDVTDSELSRLIYVKFSTHSLFERGMAKVT